MVIEETLENIVSSYLTCRYVETTITIKTLVVITKRTIAPKNARTRSKLKIMFVGIKNMRKL